MPKTSSKTTVAAADSAGSANKKAPAKKAARLPARKTFLIAATMPDGGAKRDLRVYAVVQRTPVEALAAVQSELGVDVAVELAGKLSNRMAKTLGIKPDEVRQI